MARLVVGLGNPGPEYERTRHNVGFEVLDGLAAEKGALFRSPSSLDGWTGSRGFAWARLDEPAAFLLKPGTFMNRSGDVVAPVARWLARSGELPLLEREPDAEAEADAPPDVDPRAVMVVYDDMDLDVGRLRLRPHGGTGGHNGMRSIVHRLGTDRFPRFRVGVGRPATDAARHVLSTFDAAEREEIEISIAWAVEALLAWLDGEDLGKVMTRFHSRWNQDA